jgi:hypothetical protein
MSPSLVHVLSVAGVAAKEVYGPGQRLVSACLYSRAKRASHAAAGDAWRSALANESRSSL